MNKLVSFGLTGFLFFNGISQTIQPCFTNEMMQKWLLGNPSAKADFDKHQQEAKTTDSIAFLNGYSKLNRKTAVAAYTVPIVFHVLHLNGPENISDAQILDQLNILTRDFRKKNPDTVSIVAPFKLLAGDINFEFVLATKDPMGNCTNGITRHYDARTDWTASFSDYVYTWPRNMYLNVYVVRSLNNGAAAYTYLPGTVGAAQDAIVIQHNYVGSTGTSNIFFSRTLTHEVGHWFNLNHIWGNTNNAGVICGDDGVSDTPITKGFTNCFNTMPSVCNTPTVENIQNYMDYAFCAKMFTIGQGVRMTNSILGGIAGRNNLWSNSNLNATGVINPVSPCGPKAQFIVNTQIGCVGSNFTFQDLSYNGVVTNWNWNFQSGSPAVSLSSNPTVSFISSGTKTVSLKVSNGAGADSIIQNCVTVLAGPGSGTNNITQSFETISFPDNIWIANTPATGSGWTQTSLGAATGTNCVYINNYFDNPNEAAIFYTPMFNLSTMLNPAISFKVAHAQKTATNNDRLRVYYTTACGNPWTVIFSAIGSSLQTLGAGNYSLNAYTNPVAAEWRKSILDLTSIGTFTNVLFKFEFTPDSTNPGNNIFIDDINIETNTAINSYEKENSYINIAPNPFSNSTKITFLLLQKNNVKINLFDCTGKKVKSILNSDLEKGNHEYIIDTIDLAGGIYFVELKFGESVHSRKIIIQ